METKSFAKGEYVFREGDAGDIAYLVESGLIEISCEKDGKTTILGEIRPGSVFGEMALIGDMPRSAGARAKEPSTLYVIPLKAFQSEIDESSALMRALMYNFSSRIRSLIAQVEEGRGPDSKVKIHNSIDFKTYRSI